MTINFKKIGQKLDNNEFIKRARKIHGDKYDYSKVEYKGSLEKVCIICPRHGEFWQIPSSHLQGAGCRECAVEHSRDIQRLTTEEFIKRARSVHGDKYDYSKVEYKGSGEKVCIICPEHGEFWARAYNHLHGQGCSECTREKRTLKDVFIERARKIHGDKYDYSKVEYVNRDTKVCIICPIHGEFWQRPHNHLHGQGCPDCGKKYAQEWQKNNYATFIKSSKERFGDIYSFPNIEQEYENSHSKVTIKCNKCGNEFVKIACDHITSPNGGCQHCYYSKSKAEEEIGDFVKTILKDDSQITFNDRQLLKNNEIDIYIKSKKIGIEYNGLYWHSNKGKYYHLLKTEECEKAGIRLIQIFEDEYYFHKDVVLAKIKHILGMDYDLEKIYGRKCQVREIDYNTASDFLNNNHIQGSTKSTIYLGAFCNDELYGVMTFIERFEGKWELARFATDITKRSIGVGGKLFKYFVKNYNPSEVKSFADRRWTINNPNNLYYQLGFKLDGILRPDYRYFMNGSKERMHKFGFRKRTLNKKYNLPLSLTEFQMAEKIGAKKIWDCGLFRYVWRQEDKKEPF